MIEIKKLTVIYDDKIIIDNLDLVLESGLVHGLVGLNGSGKTTLLNTFYGFKKPVSGKIFFENRKLIRTDMAYLETDNFFYSNITGLEYLQLFTNDLSDLNIWNELLLLPLDELIEYYSTGMKKKLAILAVIKLNREILILDEPFNGLDIETTELLKKIILKLRLQNKTIILTSHIFEILMDVCNEIHFLDNSTINRTINQSEFSDFHYKLMNQIHSSQSAILDKLIK